jgi:hypothetical protein
MSWGVYRPQVWIHRPSQPRELAAFTSPFVIWNPYDRDANITLSNNNLTATMSGAVNDKIVRANRSSASGDFEVTFSAFSGTANKPAVGLSNTSEPTSNYVGQTTNSIGYYGQYYSIYWYFNCWRDSNFTAWGVGDAIG